MLFTELNVPPHLSMCVMPTDPLKKSAPAPVCVTAAASTQHAELCVRAGAEGGFSGFCRLSATSGATK